MYKALYRKYRPKNYSDVVGQDVILQCLKNTVLYNKINHAYLFTGPRGTGKTSMAKLLAKSVNCLNFTEVGICNECSFCIEKNNIDIIEIDAASNNGVDEIRELRNKITFVPTNGKYKVYIIDEVHMLTNSAFNALLKTLEEPPEHIIFVLATTEPHKIPLTILSRCIRFDFNKISIKDLNERIKKIVEIEKIQIDEEAISLISYLSDGGLRDSISMLDKLTVYSPKHITLKDVETISGTLNNTDTYKFLILIFKKNLKNILTFIEKMNNQGVNFLKLTETLIIRIKDMILYKENIIQDVDESIKLFINESSNKKLLEMLNELMDLYNKMKVNINEKLIFELGIIKISNKHFPGNKKTLLKEENVKETVSIKKGIVEEETIKSKSNDNDLVDFEKLKKIRVNNALCNFNKKETKEMSGQIKQLSEKLINPKLSELISLILDGTLKIKGSNYLVFVYKIKSMSFVFNNSIYDIEKIFSENFNNNFKVVSLDFEEWEIVKDKFNNKKIKLKYIDDRIDIKKTKKQIESNVIENMFDEIIEYK